MCLTGPIRSVRPGFVPPWRFPSPRPRPVMGDLVRFDRGSASAGLSLRRGGGRFTSNRRDAPGGGLRPSRCLPSPRTSLPAPPPEQGCGPPVAAPVTTNHRDPVGRRPEAARDPCGFAFPRNPANFAGVDLPEQSAIRTMAAIRPAGTAPWMADPGRTDHRPSVAGRITRPRPGEHRFKSPGRAPKRKYRWPGESAEPWRNSINLFNQREFQGHPSHIASFTKALLDEESTCGRRGRRQRLANGRRSDAFRPAKAVELERS